MQRKLSAAGKRGHCERKRWLIPYLQEKRGLFALFFLFICIYLAIFYLYHLSLEPVLYASVLCACAAVPVLVFDYIRYKRKRALLLRLRETLERGMDGREPHGAHGESGSGGPPCRVGAGGPSCGVGAGGPSCGGSARMPSCGADVIELDELPPESSGAEREYQKMLLELCEKARRREADFEAMRGDMADYYTMWVHQIKTPIAAMRLLLQTGGELEAEGISEQLFKIEEYVNMVLQYLRLDGGNDLLIRTCELDDIVRQAVRKYAGLFVRKKLTLRYEPLECRVLTDEKWLVFVVEQLLSNALKYTRKGGISIYMEPGEEKTLVIEDTGIGIAGEDLPRIFEKGFTGYNGRADKKSTGIGLYLCRRILKRLSHTIQAESGIGRGTRMKLCLKSEELGIE